MSDAGSDGRWVANTGPLVVAEKDADVGYNVEGRQVTAPQLGFGRLWRNEYCADFGREIDADALCADWKANFGDYWPELGRFHPPRRYQVQPGTVAPLELGPNIGPSVASGVVVVHADDHSFSFVTPEGHMFAALITFSVTSEDQRVRAQISILLRTSDPLYESAWPLLKAGENFFWPATLRNLAAAHGASPIEVRRRLQCVDRGRIWRNWRNVRKNALVLSALHGLRLRLSRRRA